MTSRIYYLETPPLKVAGSVLDGVGHIAHIGQDIPAFTFHLHQLGFQQVQLLTERLSVYLSVLPDQLVQLGEGDRHVVHLSVQMFLGNSEPFVENLVGNFERWMLQRLHVRHDDQVTPQLDSQNHFKIWKIIMVQFLSSL